MRRGVRGNSAVGLDRERRVQAVCERGLVRALLVDGTREIGMVLSSDRFVLDERTNHLDLWANYVLLKTLRCSSPTTANS